MDRTDLIRRLHEFAQRKGLIVRNPLGSGVHGSVFAAEYHAESGRSALKSFTSEKWYRQERDVYLRIRQRGITQVRGCHVPEMIDFDDSLWVIEMTVVVRPFVLDFAGAYLDKAPDFSDEVLAQWRADKKEQFESRWGEVQAILRALEAHGIFMIDVNPGNISFAD
jgi:hypothetical protein